MTTCRDCIHYDVCSKKHWHVEFNKYACDLNDIENRCDDFKDKSLILEKPCNVGNCVYLIAPQWNGKENKLTILKGIVTDYEFNSDDRFNEYKAVFEELGYKQTLRLNRFNIDWFTDISKAEAQMAKLCYLVRINF